MYEIKHFWEEILKMSLLALIQTTKRSWDVFPKTLLPSRIQIPSLLCGAADPLHHVETSRPANGVSLVWLHVQRVGTIWYFANIVDGDSLSGLNHSFLRQPRLVQGWNHNVRGTARAHTLPCRNRGDRRSCLRRKYNSNTHANQMDGLCTYGLGNAASKFLEDEILNVLGALQENLNN